MDGEVRDRNVDDRHRQHRRRYLGLHCDVVEAADLIEHGREGVRDPRLADGGGELSDPQVLDVGALPMRPHQRVVGAPERE